MTDKQFNKPFFTETNSPVPLIPTDMAWDAMKKKLDEEKRKRRFIIWIPLRIYGLLTVLLTGAGVLMWWADHTSNSLYVKNDNKKTQHHSVKDPGKSAMPVTIYKGNKKNPDYEPRYAPLTDTINKQQTVNINNRKVNNKKNAIISTPIPTAVDPGHNTAPVEESTWGRMFQPKKRSRWGKEGAGRGDDDKILPFSFPERTAITGSILVQANRPLPALLSRQPANDSNCKKSFWVEAGLQWNVPVPFEGYNYYLKDPDGNNQFYRLLLPGIWGAVNRNKHRVIAMVNPFVSAPLPAKDYGDGMVPVTDSFSVFGHKRMVKMFGVQAQLQYAYRLTGRWSLGAGIEATWWKKGLALANPLDSGISFKPFLYSINPKKVEGIKAFQMSASLTLSYQFRSGEGILQISKPFNKTIQTVPIPVWLSLGIRWRLLDRKW